MATSSVCSLQHFKSQKDRDEFFERMIKPDAANLMKHDDRLTEEEAIKEAANDILNDFIKSREALLDEAIALYGKQPAIADNQDDLDALFDQVLSEELASRNPKPSDSKPTKAPKPPRTATQAAQSAATNTVKGLDNAIQGLGELFGGKGRLSSGLTFDEETYAKAKPYFLEAVKNLQDAGTDIKEVMRAIVKMVLDRFGAEAAQNMKPYALRFVSDYRDGVFAKDEGITIENAKAFAEKLLAGESFKTIVQARKALTSLEIEPGTPLAKQADEAIELAGVMAARKIVDKGLGKTETYDALVKLADQMPSLNVRSSTSVAQQAYSTPLPLAYVAAIRAGIDKSKTVVEPTGGNGALLITADPAKTVANELNPDRVAALNAQGFEALSYDASDFKFGNADADVVIANPPFGVVKDENGNSKTFKITPVYSTNEIDHAIALNSLKAMAKDGKAVLIVGGPSKTLSDAGRSDAYNGKAKRAFYYTLYNEYNVTDHFTVSGSLYAKQGAAWPVDVIVIDGRGKSQLALPAAGVPRIINTFEELKDELQNDRSSVRQTRVSIEQAAAGSTETGDAGNVLGNAENGLVQGDSEDGQPDGVLHGHSGRDKDVRLDMGNQDVAGKGDGVRKSSGANTGDDALTNKYQAEYTPASKANPIGSLVPVNMQNAIKEALQKIVDKHGDIDEYVANLLGYKADDLSNYFSAEQVDSIALALNNITNGKGFIIGSQTGIGKGRVNAAMIKYAIKNKITPIFVTEKPNLYSDMIRDLNDIGMDIMPFATNMGNDGQIPLNAAALRWDTEAQNAKDKGEKAPPIPNDAVFAKMSDAKKRDFLQGGTLKGHDVIFTTYNQMQTIGNSQTDRQAFLEKMADGGLLILDESHNAGGTSVTQKRGKNAPDEGEKTGRAAFARKLVSLAKGVFYSSATYAKRPDVLDLYSKTDMGLVADPESLKSALVSGGVPLQQSVASMLAKAGQYIRHEKSFNGIVYDTVTVDVDRVFAEKTSEIMREIMKFDDLKAAAIKAIKDDIKGAAGTMSGDRSTGKAGADSKNFTSVMHNMIGQMLLTLKVQPTIDEALAALRRNEKPVIALSNTMGSAIEEYVADVGLNPGDAIGLSFGDILKRYANKSRRVTEGDPFGKKIVRQLTDAELGPLAVAQFKKVLKLIDTFDFNKYPVSPIDAIHAALAKEGYKSGEITGRQAIIDYSDQKTPIYRRRPSQQIKAAGKRKVINDFNNGLLDVIILNQSGATGLSLHASPKVGGDTRKRHMIITQAELNIDTHMQMLGRTNRTGQIVLPAYGQLTANIPAEKRIAAILANKMAMLNANTTAGKDSAVKAKDVPDFMNNYGDEVVAAIMNDNRDIHKQLGKPLSPASSGEGFEVDGAMRRVTGRIPVLSLKDQEDLYQLIEDEYNEYIDMLTKTGQNQLEAQAMDLDAITMSSTVVVERTDKSDSPFAEGVTAEKVDVKLLGKPYTIDQINGLVAKQGITDEASSKSLFRVLLRSAHRAAYNKRMSDINVMPEDDAQDEKKKEAAKVLLSAQKEKLDHFSKYYIPGEPVLLTYANGAEFLGIVGKLERKGNAKSYFAMGQWKMTVYVADTARSLTLPLSKFTPDNGWSIQRASKDEVIKALNEGESVTREKRYILTGNMLAAYGFDKSGRIVNYTKSDGEIVQGVLMPKAFKLEKAIAAQPVVFQSPDIAIQFAQVANGTNSLRSADNEVRLIRQPQGDFVLFVPASKARGGAIFTNPRLNNVIGDFYKRGNDMSARVQRSSVADVIRILYPITGPMQPVMKEDGKKFLAENNISEPKGLYTQTDLFIEARKPKAKRDDYQTDLFGNSLPDTGRASKPKEPRNVQPSPTVQDTPRPRGNYAMQTGLLIERTRKLGTDVITTPKQLAQAITHLQGASVEFFDAIITDAKGKPLAVVGTFKGEHDGASVYPAVVVAEAFRVEGAAHIWFTHNHPSGRAELSNADRNIARKLQAAFDGSSIKAHGIMATTFKGFWDYEDPDTYDHEAGRAVPSDKIIETPVVERIITDFGVLGEAITSPEIAERVVPAVARGQAGLVLMDNQHNPTAFLPLTPDQVKPLKGTGQMDTIYRALSLSNAKASILYDPKSEFSSEQYKNLGTFLNGIDNRFLDVLRGEEGFYTSISSSGLALSHSSGTFYSKGKAKENGFTVDQLKQALPDYLQSLLKTDSFKVITAAEAVKITRDPAARSSAGFYDTSTQTTYFVADNIDDTTDLDALALHEIGVHARQLGKNDAEFKDILKQLKGLIESGNAKAVAAKNLVPKGTPKNQELEETLAYLVQENPTLPISQRFIAWMRNAIRKLGKLIPVMDRVGFVKWANSLSTEDMVYMSHVALRQDRGLNPSREITRNDGALMYSIAPSQKSPMWRRWFAKSKMVRDGKPIKFYHGSQADFTVFEKDKLGTNTTHSTAGLGHFFSAQKAEAESYGDKVHEVYLSIQNPFVTTSERLSEKFKDSDGAKRYQEKLRGQGYDGVYIKDAYYAVAFDSQQVKLTSNESPSFASDIRYSMLPPIKNVAKQGNAWLKSFLNDTTIYNLQDRFIDLKRQIEKAVSEGGEIDEDSNPYLKEELYHQRTASRIKDFYDKEVNPLLEALHEKGVKLSEFQKLLHARHAPSRNAVMSMRNPNQAIIDVKLLEAEEALAEVRDNPAATRKELSEALAEYNKWRRAKPFNGTEEARLSLSGMTNTEARAIISSADPELIRLADKIDAINNKTLDLLVQYGMETPETVKALKKQWRHYVPLHRDEAHPDDNNFGQPIGRGFSVRGSGMQSATGSNAEVTNILAHIMAAREQMLRRGEKNRVSHALAEFVKLNPDNDFATVDTVEVDKVLGDDGLVRPQAEPIFKRNMADNVVMYRVEGKDHAIVFNDNKPETVRLAMSLKNLDGANLDAVESLLAKGTRWFSRVNTQYNVVFGIVNLMRDTQAMALNLTNTPLHGKQGEILMPKVLGGKHFYLADAFKAILQTERQFRNADPRLKAMYDRFNKAGGTTGYAQMFEDIKSRNQTIEKEFAKLGAGKAMKKAIAMGKVLTDFNTLMENSTRLAVFMSAVNNGLSDAQAASLAKNITVNFNRKGAQATKIGAFYAFFNASAQGTAKLVETLSGPKGREIMTGAVLLGAATTAMGLMMMGDDDWEKIPEFVRERSLILPTGKDTYISIPMPLGFHLFPNIGRKLVESAFGSNRVSLTQRFLQLSGSTVSAFNPLGGSDVSEFVMPTVLDPALALWRNKDWTGHSIYKEDFNSLKPTPGFTRTKDSATWFGKTVAEVANKATGGTDYKQGLWSPTPDQIDYVIGQFTGGTGREIMKVQQTIAGALSNEEVPLYKTPLVGRLFGRTSGNAAERNAYYENLRRLNEHEAEVKGLRKEGKLTELKTYIAENPEASLIESAGKIERAINKLNDKRKDLRRQGESTTSIDMLIGAQMKRFNDQFVGLQ